MLWVMIESREHLAARGLIATPNMVHARHANVALRGLNWRICPHKNMRHLQGLPELNFESFQLPRMPPLRAMDSEIP